MPMTPLAMDFVFMEPSMDKDTNLKSLKRVVGNPHKCPCHYCIIGHNSPVRLVLQHVGVVVE